MSGQVEDFTPTAEYPTRLRKSAWGNRLCAATILACLFFVSTTQAEESDASAKAAKVKAVFLYNFIKFVEWPVGRSPAATHKAEICLMGGNPFGSALTALKTTLSNEMELTIANDVPVASLGECNVLFINNAGDSRLDGVLDAAKRNNVLTVSEANEFADNGGVIEMKTVEKTIGLFSSNKINLRINLKAAEASGLRISAQLLEISAEVIK